jgi:predicted phage gp36 major capsid-like protein
MDIIETTTNYSYIETDTYYEFTLNSTLGGVGIGFPYYIFSQTYQDIIGTMTIDWELISATSNACKFGFSNNTGSNVSGVSPSQTILSVTSRARTSDVYTVPNGANGMVSWQVLRNASTCDAVFRIYQILDANGEVIWSPELANQTAEITFPSDIQFQSDTIVWSMGFMIFLMSLQTWYIIIRRK